MIDLYVVKENGRLVFFVDRFRAWRRLHDLGASARLLQYKIVADEEMLAEALNRWASGQLVEDFLLDEAVRIEEVSGAGK